MKSSTLLPVVLPVVFLATNRIGMLSFCSSSRNVDVCELLHDAQRASPPDAGRAQRWRRPVCGKGLTNSLTLSLPPLQ